VLNSAGGGAALSTIGLIEAFRKEGVEACAVSHDAGSIEERERLREATQGEVLFTPLYWWNKKIRSDRWKRPLLEAHQILRTGWSRYSAMQVRLFAVQHRVDLIHTNTILTPEGGLAARALGLPHVWHLRELLGPGQPFRLRLEGKALGRYLASHCSRLIANSRTTAECVRDWLPPGLLEMVANGIDASRFTIRSGSSSSDQVVVAMIGSLSSRWKKHELFIEAAARVDLALRAEFRIYGHDPSRGGQVPDEYTNKLRGLVGKLGLTDRFKFSGFSSDPAQAMSEIDVLVHPADNESFGRIIVEAMAAGLPVVGVRGGGTKEIVVENVSGLLAEPDNAVQLASLIEQVLRDPALRKTLERNGRLRAESVYSLDQCAAGVMRVYQQAMERPLTKSNRQISQINQHRTTTVGELS
jgi:glycosyltransferase involved in cell wall biosynthesis